MALKHSKGYPMQGSFYKNGSAILNGLKAPKGLPHAVFHLALIRAVHCHAEIGSV